MSTTRMLASIGRYVRDVAAGIWHGLIAGLRELDRNAQAGFDRLWYGS